MPYLIPALAGQPYCPSNVAEGDMFREKFCERCLKDRVFREHGQDGCQILAAALCYDLDEPEYPKEWTHDAEGRPTCTAFERDPKVKP